MFTNLEALLVCFAALLISTTSDSGVHAASNFRERERLAPIRCVGQVFVLASLIRLKSPRPPPPPPPPDSLTPNQPPRIFGNLVGEPQDIGRLQSRPGFGSPAKGFLNLSGRKRMQ